MKILGLLSLLTLVIGAAGIGVALYRGRKWPDPRRSISDPRD